MLKLSSIEAKIVEEDILRAEKAIEDKLPIESIEKINKEFDVRYSNKIKDWKAEGTIYLYTDNLTNNDWYEHRITILKNYLIRIKEFFKTGWNAEANVKIQKSGTTINIENNNINVNENNQNIFLTIKQKIENACLNEKLEEDALKKIAELEKLINSNETKNNKWKKAKNIFKWAIEQGIQIASIILPLIDKFNI